MSDLKNISKEERKKILPIIEEVTEEIAINNLFHFVEKAQKNGIFETHESYIIHLSKVKLINYFRKFENKDEL